jgi:hypothetical protein
LKIVIDNPLNPNTRRLKIDTKFANYQQPRRLEKHTRQTKKKALFSLCFLMKNSDSRIINKA